MNPYHGANFFEFIGIFFARIPEMLQLHFASDELQIFTLFMIALSCSVVGSFLVLNRMTMFANAVSHTILLGMLAAFLLLTFSTKIALFSIPLSILFIGAIFAALFTAFCIHLLEKTFKVEESMSIGFVFTFLFAIGVLLLSIFARNAHIGVELLMGNVDGVVVQDLTHSFYLMLVCLLSILIPYRFFLIFSFDSLFAQSLKVSQTLMRLALFLLCAFTVVSGLKVVGVVLVLNFMTAPYLVMRRISHHLKTILIGGAILSFVVCFTGVALSRHILSVHHLALSTSGLCVAMQLIAFLAVYIVHDLIQKRKIQQVCEKEFAS